MSYGLLKDILSTAFGEFKDHRHNEQIQINCPHCAKLYNNYELDNKFNLEINLNKKLYRCWKCEISGPLPKLIKYYAKKNIYDIYIDNFDNFDYIQNTNGNEDDDEIYSEIILPKEFIPFSEMDKDLPTHLEAYNYIKNVRNIDDKIIHNLNIGFCDEGYYKNRILIPSYDIKGKLNYFVTRTFVNDPITYIKPKINQDVIFNENKLDWNSTIYVVEGGFDYISIPINTLCLLGKDFIPFIFEKIIKYKPPLVFILDPDAMKQTIKYINIFDNMEVQNIKYIELNNNMDIDEIRKKIGSDKLGDFIKQKAKYLTDMDIINYQ